MFTPDRIIFPLITLIRKKNTLRIRASIVFLFFIAAITGPLYFTMDRIISGNIPFWYDPARDLSAAVVNLNKINLIGQPTGIPGLFYGPYWIWFLSVGLLLSKDPRLILILIISIPYLIIFPLLLVRLFGNINGLILWLIFFLSVGFGTMTHLWNPVIAPLLLLILIYVASRLLQQHLKNIYNIFFFGFLSGILVQFHMSLGLAVLIANIIFIFTFNLKTKNNYMNKLIAVSIFKKNIIFFIGLFISFLPFLIFEIRHNFMQITSVYKTFISGEQTIGITGMPKLEIIQTFFGRFEDLFKQPLWLVIIIAILLICLGLLRNKLRLTSYDNRIIFYLILLSVIILVVYLSAKNPVWDYHFLGIEVIFLVLAGVFMEKIPSVRIFFILLLLANISVFIKDYTKISRSDPLTHGSFYTKKYITELILEDAKNEKFTLYAYSPSIYIFEYAYLFNWLGEVYVPYDPSLNPAGSGMVYLIIPKSGNLSIIEDFIHYRTPPEKYKTVKTMRIPDGTVVLKRLLNE